MVLSYATNPNSQTALVRHPRETTPLQRGERTPLLWEHEGNRAARCGDWKGVGPSGEPWKPFDMSHDRTELHDVSDAYPTIKADLIRACEAGSTE